MLIFALLYLVGFVLPFIGFYHPFVASAQAAPSAAF